MTAATVKTLPCADGWTLSVEEHIPQGGIRAVAVVGHAMMVDRRTMDARGDGLVSELARAGVAVLSADLRGHGQSGPLAAEGGRWDYDDLVEQDARALVREARARFPGARVVAVGHSLFGHVAIAHAARFLGEAPDAIVAIAANLWLPRWEPSPSLRLVKRAILEGSAAVARAIGYLPARRVRFGSADESRDYCLSFVRDWHADRWSSNDFFDYTDALASVRTPVLAIVGSGDRLMCREPSARRMYREIPSATVELAGRASGLPIDPDHMQVVTDERCRPLWQRIARFVVEGK